MLEKLSQLFEKNSKNGKINPRTIARLVKENSWISEELFSEFEYVKDLYSSSFFKFLIAKVKGILWKHCKHCGKLLTYDQTTAGAVYCSNKCKLSKGENPFSREEVKDKIKDTCMKKYGASSPSKIEALKRYGAKNCWASEEVKKKIKASQVKKFGRCFSQTEEFKEKLKKTSIERYSVSHKNILKAYEKACSSLDAEPLFTLEEFAESNREKDFLKWRCKLCGREFCSRWDNGMLTSKCKCQFSKANEEGSKGEQELSSFISSLGVDIAKHFKLPGSLEIDIYVPSLNLGFEFNGSYWHSIQNGHGNGYHLKKTLAAEKEGIHLVHVWEDEWKTKKEEVKEKIRKTVEGVFPSFSEEDVVKLDRCWFSSSTEVPGYCLEEVIPPQIVIREGNETEDCGFLVFTNK